MAAVHKHNALIKASIMSATNAHRLGANEAPPSIISMFLGEHLSRILEEIANDKSDILSRADSKEKVSIDVAQIPLLARDNTDRNRTSPFAFTGNRFEFRAVGSSANNASAMIVINAAVADQLNTFADRVDARTAAGEGLNDVLLDEVKSLIREASAIHFDGNGYSDEWKQEAARRGLDTEDSAPLIFDAYLRPESVDMFSRTAVLSSTELAARNEVKWETYTKKIQIESRVLGDLAVNHILPVAIRYQNLLLDNVSKINALFDKQKAATIASQDMMSIEEMSDHISTIKRMVDEMIECRKVANRIASQREKAIAYHDTVAPLLEQIRYHIDKLELMVDNELWPLPKYREILFIR